MKLLYVWIEEFRNIHNQGIVVDNEFSISVTDSHNSSFDYYTDDGSRIIPTKGTPKYGRKIFTRKISWLKNDDYPTCKVECAIDSISALVGKNAVGKSSILDCLSSQEHEYLRIDTRYYFLAHLNRSEHCIEIRSKGIRIISEDVIFLDSYKTTGYETYIIPLENFSPTYPCISDEQTTFYFLISQKKASSYVGYTVLGMPTIVGDLDAFNNYNAFEGAFDFLCHFPTLVSSGNKLAVFLDSADRNQHNDYFEKANLTCAEYKNFYIQRLAQILFSNLRTYLYHPQPVFMMSSRREKLPNEDVLIEEDKRYAQLLAIFNGLYPHEGVADLISSKTNRIPQAEIREVLNFFSNSTYSFNGKFAYDEYLKNISQLFEALFVADDKLFPAIFKLELPFLSQYEPIVSALQKCVNTSDILNENWANGLNIRFEWFSSGEFHLSMLFSAIYQRMKETDGNTSNRDVIWAIDEPEMHMHPELGRSFIDELNRAMRQFKDIGLFRTCQFIFATHSPFLIQSLGQYTSTLTLVEKDNNQIFAKAFDNIPQLRFPGRTELSFNLIMFKIFGVPTVELHNELLGELKRVVNSLLQNVDAMSSDSLLLAATNHEQLLDSAVWRRFDYKLEIELPDTEAMIQMVDLFVSNSIDLSEKEKYELAVAFQGLSGANIEEIIKKAFINAIIHEKAFNKLNIYNELFIFKNILPQTLDNPKESLRIKARFLRGCNSRVFSLQVIADILESSKTTIQKLVKEADES